MKAKKFIFTLMLTALFFASFFTGYFLIKKSINNIENEKYNAKTVGTIKPQIKNLELVTISTEVLMINIYSKGIPYNLEITEKADSNIVGMNKDEVENYYKQKGYLLTQFSKEQIKITKQINTWCPKTFVVKDIDGSDIGIYNVDDNGELILKENTNIKISNLPQEDENDVLKGKTLATQQDVDNLIEDYSS